MLTASLHAIQHARVAELGFARRENFILGVRHGRDCENAQSVGLHRFDLDVNFDGGVQRQRLFDFRTELDCDATWRAKAFHKLGGGLIENRLYAPTVRERPRADADRPSFTNSRDSDELWVPALRGGLVVKVTQIQTALSGLISDCPRLARDKRTPPRTRYRLLERFESRIER